MARVQRFDQKAANNRARIQRCRHLKKMKMIHEKEVSKRLKSQNVADSETSGDTEGNGATDVNLDKATEIKNKLRYWASSNRITTTAINELLSILKFAGFGFLPKDSRTLKCTPACVTMTSLSQGKIWYNGIEKCLKNTLAGLPRDISITLDFNFDGLPISKSSNMQFWPILSSIRGMLMHSINSSV